jgi:integrase
MKRVPIAPPTKFAKAMKSAQESGEKLIADGITLEGPTSKRPTWRLRFTFQNETKERSGGRSLDTAYAAYVELKKYLASAQSGVIGQPQNSKAYLHDLVENYLTQGGPKFVWNSKTKKNRREDLRHLILLGKKINLKCEDLNVNHLRTFINTATASQKRSIHILKVLKTFLDYAYKAGYISIEQAGLVASITWTPPAGSSYEPVESRRQQSQTQFGTEISLGGMIPTHGEVIELAKALQAKYLHGEALIHISANLGTRANETFLLTASEAVFKKGQGNYVDTKGWNALVHWQVNDDPNKAYKTTKNKKNRAVHIPSVDVIASGFDIRKWLEQRSIEALEEQSLGQNPNALLFPNSKGEYIKLHSFSVTYMKPVLESLNWRMAPYVDARGKVFRMNRFTLHALRDRFATTAADEWKYSERQLLEQGSWSDAQTVRKYYLGTTSETFDSVKQKHLALSVKEDLGVGDGGKVEQIDLNEQEVYGFLQMQQ